MPVHATLKEAMNGYIFSEIVQGPNRLTVLCRKQRNGLITPIQYSDVQMLHRRRNRLLESGVVSIKVKQYIMLDYYTPELEKALTAERTAYRSAYVSWQRQNGVTTPEPAMPAYGFCEISQVFQPAAL